MSSKTFQLDIITPNGSYTIGKVDYLRAPSLDGLFGVMANHIPSIIAIGIDVRKTIENANPIGPKASVSWVEKFIPGIIEINIDPNKPSITAMAPNV